MRKRVGALSIGTIVSNPEEIVRGRRFAGRRSITSELEHLSANDPRRNTHFRETSQFSGRADPISFNRGRWSRSEPREIARDYLRHFYVRIVSVDLLWEQYTGSAAVVPDTESDINFHWKRSSVSLKWHILLLRNKIFLKQALLSAFFSST